MIDRKPKRPSGALLQIRRPLAVPIFPSLPYLIASSGLIVAPQHYFI
jgi:hypothetical protein